MSLYWSQRSLSLGSLLCRARKHFSALFVCCVPVAVSMAVDILEMIAAYLSVRRC